MNLLVTKAEHILGEKVLALTTRWGEAVKVKLKALGWRDLQSLSATAAANNWNQQQHAEELVNQSIAEHGLGDGTDVSGPPNGGRRSLLDMLEAGSASLLQRTAFALSLGERLPNAANTTPEKNAQAPVVTNGSSTAGELNAPSLRPDGVKEISPDGVRPSSALSSKSSSDSEQAETGSSSPSSPPEATAEIPL